MLLLACKPSLDSSKVKAVSNSDGTIAFTVVPVRNFFDSSRATQVAKSPISASLLQSLTVANVRCDGKTAKVDAVLLEMTLLASGASLLRKGAELYQSHDDGARLINRCKITGSHVGGSASVSSLLTGSPSLAKQSFYLGMRGATTLDAQTASPFLYEMLRENLGIRFKDAKQYAQLSRELDILYNPCLLDKSANFDKLANFSCANDGHYIAKDVNGAQLSLSNFFKTSETAHIEVSSKVNKSASKLYSQLVSITVMEDIEKSDATLEQKSLGTVLSGNRTSIADSRGWLTENTITFGQTEGSPAGLDQPSSGTPGWRKHGQDSLTKDGISFFYERSPGKYQRIVHTGDNSLYVSAEKKNLPQMLKLARMDDAAFALAGPNNVVNPEPVNPAKTPWTSEQGPVVSKALDDYRSGKINGTQVTSQLSSVTKHLPFGQKDRGDKWTDAHNCVDIAMATCRAMYRVLPEGSFVGTAGVYDASKNSKGAHMINYFSFPNKQGSRDIVAYDQQSGAMSKPMPSFEDAIADPQFAAGTSRYYTGVDFKITYPTRPDAKSRVISTEIDPKMAIPGKMTPRQDVANYYLPKLFAGQIPSPDGDGIQIGGVGTYTPQKPNYLWQQVQGKSIVPRLGRAFGMGYIKDGTHGKHLIPENAEWYAPLRK